MTWWEIVRAAWHQVDAWRQQRAIDRAWRKDVQARNAAFDGNTRSWFEALRTPEDWADAKQIPSAPIWIPGHRLGRHAGDPEEEA